MATCDDSGRIERYSPDSKPAPTGRLRRRERRDLFSTLRVLAFGVKILRCAKLAAFNRVSTARFCTSSIGRESRVERRCRQTVTKNAVAKAYKRQPTAKRVVKEESLA